MTEPDCTHYWILDSENIGTCKYCGEVKDFMKASRQQWKRVASRRKKEGGASYAKGDQK